VPDVGTSDRGSGLSARLTRSIVAASLVTLAACAGRAHASQTYPGPPSVEQLARQAAVIVVGDVAAVAGELSATGAIHTRITLTAIETLKGAPTSTPSFTQIGGRVGDRISAAGGAAQFTAGERVLVFLARRSDGSLRLANFMHGKFSVEYDAASGREYAVRSTGAPGADRIPLDQVRADVRRTLGDGD
jgi:hypothetical protein